MILVNSFGGCATTMFTASLWRANFSNNKSVAPCLVWDDGKSGQGKNECRELKHTPYPPPSNTGKAHNGAPTRWMSRRQGVTPPKQLEVIIEKAVYLYVDPLEAILTFLGSDKGHTSIDGKGVPWPIGHAKNLGGDWSTFYEMVRENYTDVFTEADFSNHLFKVGHPFKGFPHHPSAIDMYASQHEDLFGLENHFDNWTNTKTDYPILAIKYEALWKVETLRKISKFLDLQETTYVNNFPPKKSRLRELTSLSPSAIKRLETIYQSLTNKMKAKPSCTLNGEEY